MKYGLLGKKLGHSYSKMIHEQLGGYAYELFEREDAGKFLMDEAFSGINVTIPYKETVIPYCAELSELARTIGSVNTIVKRTDGTLYGDNTDAYGFLYLLKKHSVDPMGKKAIVLGSGGASKTVCAMLKKLGAREVVIISRSGENNYRNLSKHYDCKIIVNTTPVGMYPHCKESPIDLAYFTECEAVMDLIYNPARTELLLQADALKIKNGNGLPMLVAQAKQACELFMQREIPERKIDEITEKIEKETRNLVLIGMPGCGKSSVGRLLAEKLSQPFYDNDEEIVKRTKKSIPEIFAQDGEEAFRRIEAEIFAELTEKSGLVIAAGGGIVTRRENLHATRRNSLCILLKRDLAELDTSDRPVSQAKGVRKIYEERLPLYLEFAEKQYENIGIDETAEQIWEELCR